ncbi:endonuclease/exonuclease/phosphatase family protein [Nonomuraea polychroma]|uniref:endonuclease/exonuclease/phosphatase family protein n=1 Tax=Nonomuraea polychroma TaxID=46176 RepID=UPI003D93993E
MTSAARRIRVGSYNLRDGGLDRGDDTRLQRQLRMLAAQELDIVGLQEAKYWDRDHRRLLYAAEHALGMRAVLVESSHHGCHLVTLVRPPLRIIEERHETGHPYWHAASCLRIHIGDEHAGGDEREIDVVNTHLAPSSPQARQQEAEAMRLLVKDRPVIALGDFNAAAVDDPVLAEKVTAPLARRKLETGPAEALLETGLVDAGAHLGDLTPTVGHAGGLAYRCDRIYTTRPQWVIGHEVAVTSDSDHALVVASFALGTSATVSAT